MITSDLKLDSERALIAISTANISGEEVNSVSARELHEKLETVTRFDIWVKRRLKEARLQEGIDYICLDQKCTTQTSSGRKGVSVRTDYALTLTSAKHIAMLERTEKGQMVRDYFIECEKQLQKVSLSLKDSLLLGVIRAQEDLDRALALNAYEVQYVVPLENKVQELEPKAEFYDDCVDAEGLLKLKEAAKILGTGRNRLCQFLRDHKVFMRNSTEPYQRFVESGWFVVKVITINGFNHSVTLITGKGLTKIKSLFEKDPTYD